MVRFHLLKILKCYGVAMMNNRVESRRKARRSERKIKKRPLRERVLIVCEGEKTEPNYFKKFPIDENKFYQVKIKGDTSGDHFMACYVKDKVLYLSDTSYRGIGVKAVDFINVNNFQKIMEVC